MPITYQTTLHPCLYSGFTMGGKRKKERKKKRKSLCKQKLGIAQTELKPARNIERFANRTLSFIWTFI